jgi:hypothetical protein
MLVDDREESAGGEYEEELVSPQDDPEENMEDRH